MNLATDAILKVKDAELKAKEILEKAHKDTSIKIRGQIYERKLRR